MTYYRTPRDSDSLLKRTVALLHRYNLRARKELGQNFLIDEEVVDRILAAGDLKPEDLVMEVGPGLGIMTAELSRQCRFVVAVEIDPKLAALLRQEIADRTNVGIVEKDILDAEPHRLIAEALGEPPEAITSGSYKVVANLPYYITSLLLRHFLEAKVKPSLMVLTLQKEVAERITAKPGKMSLLAVSVQVYGKPRIVAQVPASSFLPKPKVDSAVVRIDLYEKPAVEVDDMDAFFEVVHAGFSQARKQLHNALARHIWLPPGKATEILTEAGIEPSRRAQTLSLEEWATVYRVLKKHRGSEA